MEGKSKMFLLDELYKNDVNYPSLGSYLDKFLYYRKQKDDIDADVCKQIIDIYFYTNPLITNNALISAQSNYNKSNMKYEIHSEKNIFRGETLVNCMQLLVQIANYNNPNELISSYDFAELQNIPKYPFLCQNRELLNLVECFIMECYSEGNFFAIPYIQGYSLNQAKGRLKKKGYGYIFYDSSDTYFKVCRDYYINGINSCQLTSYIEKKYDFLNDRYHNKNGWNLFIEDNFFQSFFINNIPIELWNNTSDGFISDLTRYLQMAIQALSLRRQAIIKKYEQNISIIPTNATKENLC
jgi:hypothetical protein